MCRSMQPMLLEPPQVFFNSGDGIDEQDVSLRPLGAMHTRTGRFTAPGVTR